MELIVLNVGLNAKILSPVSHTYQLPTAWNLNVLFYGKQTVFSMFVLEALVLTFMTTPLVTLFYPPETRRRVTVTGPSFDPVSDNETGKRKPTGPSQEGAFKSRFTVVLDKLEHMPGMMALTQLVLPASPSSDANTIPTSDIRSPSSQSNRQPRTIVTEALRLIELSDRVSAVMKSSVSDSLLQTDPMLSIFRMFGQLSGINVFPTISVVKFEDLAYSVAEHARNFESDLIMVPWLPPIHDAFENPVHDHHPATSAHQPTLPDTAPATAATSGFRSPLSHNPFDIFFRASQIRSPGTATASGADANTSVSIIHSQFVRGVFSQAKTDVALFVDQSTLDFPSTFGVASAATTQHVFLPFFGGPDDRVALEFVVQICENPRIRGTVMRIMKTDDVVNADNDVVTHGKTAHLSTGEEGRNMEELNALTVGSVCSYWTTIITLFY